MDKNIVESMSSGTARDAILSQHEVLRALLADTVELAETASNAARRLDTLRVQAQKLYDMLDLHMAFEEQLLPTALRDVIGWGPELQAQIEEDHQRQRAELAAAVTALGPPPTELVKGLHVFAAALLADMIREENGLFQADIDAIATDSEGG